MSFFFKALIAEEKLIHVEAPAANKQVALSEFCITPSEHQTLKFDVKAGFDATMQLFTDLGTSGFTYQIVIDGNHNCAAIRRYRRPSITGDEEYMFVLPVGLYKSSISVVFPEIRLYLSVIVLY